MGNERTAISKIKKTLGENAISEERVFRNETTLVIRKEFILEALRLLRADPDLDFDFLSDVCGIDWLGREPRFEVVYNLYSLKHNSRIRLKVNVEESRPSLPSAVNIWPTADWHEREVFDLFGISFEGHPDLRRILNPDGFKGFPYRKDFPIR